MKNRTNKFWDWKFAISIIVFVIFIIGVFTLPYYLTTRSWHDIDFDNSGEVGDTIGGITGPFIAVAASILTFIAFWVQYKANEQQRHDIQIERFENKFYELLKLHKENVNEFFIGVGENGVDKRKAFVSMYNEFRYAFYYVKSAHRTLVAEDQLTKEYSQEKLVRLAYIFFYCGVGPNSDIMSKAMNNDEFEEILYDQVHYFLNNVKNDGSAGITFENDTVGLSVKYMPYGGHQSRLGHYYRHLFQTVKFVVNQEDKILTHGEVLDYLRTLRAQLSDHEQLMLYYNAISGFGETWIQNKTGENYFTTYKMIHNIPIPLANFGIEPQIKFEKELKFDKKLFEWLESD